MTSRDFCYWLQGFFELNGGDKKISVEQSHMIRRHLALVFKHEIDPSFGDEEKQKELNEIHTPPTKPSSGLVPRPPFDKDVLIRC